MKVSLKKVLASISEPDARIVLDALAQWADNERNGLGHEEAQTEEEQEELELRSLRCSRIEGIVDSLNMEFIRLADLD
jgi:hypothetical protein